MEHEITLDFEEQLMVVQELMDQGVVSSSCLMIEATRVYQRDVALLRPELLLVSWSV